MKGSPLPKLAKSCGPPQASPPGGRVAVCEEPSPEYQIPIVVPSAPAMRSTGARQQLTLLTAAGLVQAPPGGFCAAHTWSALSHMATSSPLGNAAILGGAVSAASRSSGALQAPPRGRSATRTVPPVTQIAAEFPSASVVTSGPASPA